MSKAFAVKATKTGIYPNGVMRQPGDVFAVETSEHFSDASKGGWMEKIGAAEAKEVIVAESEGQKAGGEQVQTAGEIQQLKTQAAIASQTGATVAPPDPRAADDTSEEDAKKSGKQNRRV